MTNDDMSTLTFSETNSAKPRGRMTLAGWSPLRSVARALLAALVALSVAVGSFKFFGFAQHQVHDQSRFQVSWRDIRITPLPVWIRSDLGEQVRYLSGLPEALNTLDQGLAEQLRDAFSLHPWVRAV